MGTVEHGIRGGRVRDWGLGKGKERPKSANMGKERPKSANTGKGTQKSAFGVFYVRNELFHSPNLLTR